MNTSVVSSSAAAATVLYNNFINSIRSDVTKKQYDYLLQRYMKFVNHDNSIENLLLTTDTKVIESDIIRYIVWLKNEQKLSAITINQYLAAVMHFYAMNDITLNRKKIGRYMGDYIRINKDRGYTYKEISQLIGFCDERAKALVYLLASTGIRIGALPALRLHHLKKISPHQYHQLYQITVYEGTREEYYCFTTPECASAIDTYLDFRSRSGEKLTDNSPLIRQQFDSIDVRKPKLMTVKSLSKLLEDKLHRSGVTVRIPITESMNKSGKIRNTVARAHGFRKFVTTNMIRAKINPEAREMLLGHRLPGNTNNYYRPDESEVLEEYLKAVDLLTINEENRLKLKVEELRDKRNEIQVMKESHEQEMKAMREEMQSKFQQILTKIDLGKLRT